MLKNLHVSKFNLPLSKLNTLNERSVKCTQVRKSMEIEIWWTVGCGVQCGSCTGCDRVKGANSGMQSCEAQENNEV